MLALCIGRAVAIGMPPINVTSGQRAPVLLQQMVLQYNRGRAFKAFLLLRVYLFLRRARYDPVTPDDTITLSGTIIDESSGFGALSFAATGLQNGAPDGLALAQADGTVLLQFLSYEGES